MAGQAWSINITAGTPGASFVPDVFSDTPRTALQAQAGDTVSWNNQTSDSHQIYQATDETYSPTGATEITEIIDKWDSSTPAYVVGGTAPATIYYYCYIHPNERGTIEVVA